MNALIVEDEMLVARDLARTLEKIGYRVSGMVKSVGEALQVLDRPDRDRPDVVLIDIVLKGRRDGVDLAHTLRTRYRLPFLFITSHADRATVERAKAARPGGYLVKPFTKDEVYASTELALMHFAGEGEKRRAPHTQQAAEDGLPPFQLKKVTAYIKEHYDEQLTIAGLAKVAGMSKYHFGRMFKESTGLPPYQYVIRERVEAAKRLLEETELSVTEVAMRTGFCSQSHLSRTFRDVTAVSPSAFREEA